jgi:tetratricopeptide (TPR) repeat protein
MSPGRLAACSVLAAVAAGCAAPPEKATLAELRAIDPDITDVSIEDSLERAEASYRSYLDQTVSTAMTPEAMRRLADLQIEKEFGIIGTGELVEMAVPETQPLARAEQNTSPASDERESSESNEDFERRALQPHEFAQASPGDVLTLPDGGQAAQLAGPQEAIATYQKILDEYPNYERSDQVLYQMSRAYDELGQPDDAIEAMQRLVAEYPESRYLDEVLFRRGEFYFVRRKYQEAEDSYEAIIALGPVSEYYELALYKLGWALYKQQFYEEALNRYIAMLDHRLSIGYDFDQSADGDEEHRILDTFRVVSLSFSNLGGPEVIDEYFATYGARSYGDRIYGNLGEFYLEKLRYQDAAAVYQSFLEQYPVHRIAPNFSMRVVQIYEKGEFPRLVVEAKKDFASRYGLKADYWLYFDPAESAEVMEFLKTNLTDLANHYHALYQDEEFAKEQPLNYQEALAWYREFLSSFPEDEESPPINYQLADLLLENQDFGQAALEYERTAYGYNLHDKADAAGYAAVYAHREQLKSVSGDARNTQMRATIDSSLRFAETFQGHEQAPSVLGAAADDLYELQEYERAIAAARTLIDRYPGVDTALMRSAWIVVAHSSIDIEQYANAEQAYGRVLDLTAEDDESRVAIVDGLAASIYKQGEEAKTLGDYRAAADHFLRVKDKAPTSSIRTAAEYDAAAALMQLEDWAMAAGVLEEFRESHNEHDLAPEATRQLAFIYRESGELVKSAEEHERIADESSDPELSREALLVAGDLYEEAEETERALGLYERYVGEYPSPLDTALEIRTRMAELYDERGDEALHHDELHRIVALDRDGGPQRSERTRFLAAKSALVLAELLYEQFAAHEVLQPLEQNLAEKQARMDAAMAAFEQLVDYEVGEVTAAATYYIAEIFYDFSAALLGSERPTGLSAAESQEYELMIEDEAYPFEEQAIEVHEKNVELMAVGVYNPWVQSSLDKLSVLMPGRYAKNEISSGFVGSIDFYAYRMPIVPEDPANESGVEMAAVDGSPAPSASVTRIAGTQPDR